VLFHNLSYRRQPNAGAGYLSVDVRSPMKAVEDPGLAAGVNVYKGAITYKAVAESQSRPYTSLSQLM